MKYIPLFLSLLIISSCSSGQDLNILSISLNASEKVSPNEIFSDLQVIQLNTVNGPFYNEVQELSVYENNYIVKDSKNTIYVFDKDGILQSSSETKVGNGYGEYTILMGYTFNSYSKLIEIMTPKEIFFYDLDFNFIRAAKLPTENPTDKKAGLFFGYIYDLEENKHLLIPTSSSAENSSIYIYDSKTESVERTIDFNEDVIADVTMQQKCFKIVNNDILFYPPKISPYIYRYNYSNMSIEKMAELDFGENGLTKSDLKDYSDVKQLKTFLLNCKKEYPVNMLFADNYMVSLIKNGNHVSDWKTMFFDKSKKKSYLINLYEGKIKKLPIMTSCNNNELYATAYKEDLPLLLEAVGKPCDLNELDSDAVFVLKYTLK